MTVSVSCPSCHLTVFVAEEDVLIATVTCRRCGLVFQPLGETESESAQSEAAVSANKPETSGFAQHLERNPSRMRARQQRFPRWVRIALCLLLLVGIGFTVVIVTKFRNVEPVEFRPQSPDESCQISFPTHAEWVNEPLTIINKRDHIESTIRLFVARNPRDGCDYVVRLVPLQPDRWLTGSRTDAETAVRDLTSSIRDGDIGRLEETTCNGYLAVQQVVRVPSQDLTFVVRGVAIDNQVYVMFVRGQSAQPENSDVQQFFNSFRHTTLPPPVTDYQAPDGEAFRPLGKIPKSSWAIFTPKGDTLYTNTPTSDWDERKFRQNDLAREALVQYEFPSLRQVAAFPLAEWGGVPHLDVKNQQFYLSGIVAHSYQISRYDLRQLKQNPLKKESANQPAAAFKFNLNDNLTPNCETVLAGDGRYLFMLMGYYSLSTDFGNTRQAAQATLCRIEPSTMRVDREMLIPAATGGVAASPDGKSVYVIANRQQTSCVVWEIDPDTWQVRRELKPRLRATHDFITASSSGLLFLNGIEAHQHSSVTRPVTVLDPTTEPPRERRLTARPDNRPLVTDGRRLVIAPAKWPYQPLSYWDVEGELKTHRANLLGDINQQREQNYYSQTQPVLSPDSRAILLGNGRVYWLAGAGSLPEVDPSAKWQP